MTQEAGQETIWLTPVMRRSLDVQAALLSERGAEELRHPDFIAGVAHQIRQLRNQVLAYYVITFIGAFVVASGGIPTSASVALFGVSVPLGLLSQQALAAIVAGLFSQYVIVFLSFAVLTGALSQQMENQHGEGWQYWLSRYDGAQAYAGLLVPRRVGFRSPKREWALIWVAYFTALLSTILHSGVVVSAAVIAFSAAQSAHAGPLTMTLSFFALLGTAMPAVLWVAAMTVPMPYRADIK